MIVQPIGIHRYNLKTNNYQENGNTDIFIAEKLCIYFLRVSWERKKNLLSLAPKAKSKLVQLNLLGVAEVSFSSSLIFISVLFVLFFLSLTTPPSL